MHAGFLLQIVNVDLRNASGWSLGCDLKKIMIHNPKSENWNLLMSSVTANIESLQHEGRLFPPPAEFSAKAHIKSEEELDALRAEASADPEKFWARMAESELHWFKKWDTVLKW